MPLSKTTQDHDEIQRWAQARGAQPAEVASTHSDGEAGILRFCFNAPNRKDKSLREISWDEFFEKFDENNLELVYQDKTAGGQKSNFNKFVHPADGDHSNHKTNSARGSGAKQSGSRAKTSGSHAKAMDSHAKGSRSTASSRSNSSGSAGNRSRSASANSTRGRAASHTSRAA